MKALSSFGSTNIITRGEFFRDLILITLITGMLGIIFIIFIPKGVGGIGYILGFFQLKFYYILIVKRFHDFQRLGKPWAKAYITYVIIVNLIFAFAIIPYMENSLLLNEWIFLGTLIGLVYLPLIIIGAIPGVPKTDAH